MYSAVGDPYIPVLDRASSATAPFSFPPCSTTSSTRPWSAWALSVGMRYGYPLKDDVGQSHATSPPTAAWASPEPPKSQSSAALGLCARGAVSAAAGTLMLVSQGMPVHTGAVGDAGAARMSVPQECRSSRGWRYLCRRKWRCRRGCRGRWCSYCASGRDGLGCGVELPEACTLISGHLAMASCPIEPFKTGALPSSKPYSVLLPTNAWPDRAVTSETRKSDATGSRMARSPSVRCDKSIVSSEPAVQLLPNLKSKIITL